MAVVISRLDKIKTFMIFLVWVTKGLYLEALGPAMIDLKIIYKTNYESVTGAVAGRGLGGFLGAILGAYLVEKFENHLDLCIALSTTNAGLFVALVASVPSIDYVWLLYVSIGSTSCIVNMAATRMALQIWKEKSSAILQLLHMGFGIGGLVGPLICSPFLAVTLHSIDENKVPQVTVIQESRASEAFHLIGVFTCLVAVPFFVFHRRRDMFTSLELVESDDPIMLSNSLNKKKSFKDFINPASYANGNFWLGSCGFLLISVYFFNLVGGEKAYISFVRTIAVDVFKFEKNDASYLNSAFWVFLTIGRFVGSFIAHFIKVEKLILLQVLLHLLSVSMISVYAMTDAHTYWFMTLIEGFLIAPLYGTGVAYANTQINMSGFCLMIIALMGSFGDFTYLLFAGWAYDVYSGIGVVMLTNFAGTALVACVILYKFVAIPCFINK